MADYFSRLRTTLPAPAREWLDRDVNDVLKAQAPIMQLRMRAGKGGNDLKRLGGRMRRRVGALLAA